MSNGLWNLRIGIKHHELMRVLNEAGDELASTKVPLAKFAEYLAGEAQDSFSNQETPEGKAWPMKRTERLQGRATLVLTGKMMNTVTNVNSGIISLTRKKLRYGVKDMPRAIAHNFGRKKRSRRGVSNVPPRKFLAMTEETRQALIDIVSDWQRETITRANRRMRNA